MTVLVQPSLSSAFALTYKAAHLEYGSGSSCALPALMECSHLEPRTVQKVYS